MNDEHIFALVETINGAYLHAIHQLALDAAFIDDISQISSSFWRSLSGFYQGRYVFIGSCMIATDAVRDFGELLLIPAKGIAAS
jgi:hypothetical protein